MAKCTKPVKNHQHSIKYRGYPIGLASSPQKVSRKSDERGSIKLQHKSPEILSSTELISAVGQIYGVFWVFSAVGHVVNALVGIIQKGGLTSLYAGWGAVLCRNVPHSIVKFYTYERLKRLMLSSEESSNHPSTLQTLVCGGLAGSTAALFTTPFDVVKARLQKQIPGSVRQYDSVIHALQEIGNKEGLKGLYRGLTPRLVMYMSQGALFFASYEFFKKTFSLARQHQNAQRIQYQENIEDTPASPATFPETPARLH